MSIFDQYENFLPGDHKRRKIELDTSEYQYLGAEETELEDKKEQPYWAFYLVTLIVASILIAQLLNLQISQGSFNRYLAEGNRIRQRQIEAPRGIIYDKNGKALVLNDVSYCLEVYPLDLPKTEKERQEFYDNLGSVTQMNALDIKDAIKEKGFSQTDPVVLKENLDRDTAMLLEMKIINLPGVVIRKKPVRNYQNILGLAQILGYVGKPTDQELKNNLTLKSNEAIGKDGIERVYQDYLRGRDGIDQLEVDSKGRAQRILSSMPPEPGDSLVLSIDADLEYFMTQTLSSELEAADSQAGSIVALDPKNGAVLGMISLPSYDNNIFSKGISSEDYQKLVTDETRPMFNRAVSGAYPSGSTIKPLVASAGLQEGVITENTTITDPGEIKVGSWTYPDWKNHSLVDVRKAIAVSCNVFFYAVGGGWDKIKGLGVEKLKDYLEKFGFGSKTGIDLPSEASGLLPSPDWKEKTKNESWYLGDTYHMAIGQGDVLATPLQMANSISAIANGGELLQPYVVSKIKDKDGQIVKEVQKNIIRKDFIDAGNLQIVREGMRQTVTSGSGTALDDLPVNVAAKTGTAQYGNEGKTHGWMVAFAPYEDPQIAIAVIIEGGGEGYASAGPVVKDIFSWYFNR